MKKISIVFFSNDATNLARDTLGLKSWKVYIKDVIFQDKIIFQLHVHYI